MRNVISNVLMNTFRNVSFILIAIVASSISSAQDPDNLKISQASKQYSQFRQQNTYPKFQLPKIKEMIKKVKVAKGARPILSEAQFKALSVEEKFTYCLYYGEDETQNCDAMLPIENEHKKIFSFIPGAFHDEYTWSERQDKFFESSRIQVAKLVAKNIRSKGRVGANFKSLILRIKLTDVIPDLITVYKADRKDHDILTVLMFLMKEGAYEPFVKSTSHEKLFGESAMYPSFIEASKANQELIMSRAMAFFKASR
jgi:hypothetical protein